MRKLATIYTYVNNNESLYETKTKVCRSRVESDSEFDGFVVGRSGKIAHLAHVHKESEMNRQRLTIDWKRDGKPTRVCGSNCHRLYHAQNNVAKVQHVVG